MKPPINIHSKNQKIHLSVGIYSVRVLGGWGVSVNDFSLSLRNLKNNTIINAERTQWRIQSYAFKKRAKRILILDVYESGEYVIEFKNIGSLRVKHSNLLMLGLFEKEISNNEIEVYIGY